MRWSSRRWDTEAVLERLGAEQAVDALRPTLIGHTTTPTSRTPGVPA